MVPPEVSTAGLVRASAHMQSMIRTNQQAFIGAGDEVPIYLQ